MAINLAKQRRRRRLFLIFSAACAIILAGWLAGSAFQDNLVYFKSPSDILANPPLPQQRLRLGGMVEKGSLHHPQDLKVIFQVTDLQQSLEVEYEGILPDLFREGQGVVAEGYWHGTGQAPLKGRFIADTILAKHDENYMPPEVAAALHQNSKDKNTKPPFATSP
jgi:cytochrome c-type biogenesis protein CcmE